LLILTGGLWPVVAAGAHDLAGPFQVHQARPTREYIVSTDELCALTHRPWTKRLPAAATVGDLKSQVAALRDLCGARVALVLYPRVGPRTEATRRLFSGQLFIQADEGSVLTNAILSSMKSPRRPGFAADGFLLEVEDPVEALSLLLELRRQPGVRECSPLLARMPAKKFLPNDPLFPRQWHLRNTGQSGGAPGIDLNVASAWNSFLGDGVFVGIVDDGLQTTHPDLLANASTSLDYDFNEDDTDANPTDLDFDVHGTQVAGLVGARGNNGLGVSGVAPRATLVGVRLLGGPTTDLLEAEALAYANDSIQIKNNSWGAPDGTGLLEDIGPLAAAALAQGAQSGRNGRGTIFVFSAGNGRLVGDNANYDGYVNSLFAIAVGAVSDQGTQASYSESGACLTVVAPSGSAARPRIVTTDLAGLDGADPGDYTTNFIGTSASAPLVSGVVALMLQANPQLGWRDVREILMRSATVNDRSDADWVTNRAGFHFNHKYGAGLVNATEAVALAVAWTNLAAGVSLSLELTNLSLSVPDNQPAGVNVSFTVTNQNLRVEHVALHAELNHDDWGDLEITLQSPSGLKSVLAEPHSPAFDQAVDWTFTSVRHWGEPALGTWTVNFADRRFLNVGQVKELRLDIYGSPFSGPPASLSIRRLPDAIELTLHGKPGGQYVLESSSAPFDWQPLATLVTTNGEATYRDTRPFSATQFYRTSAIGP
jgi:subtilisin family serine protease